MERKICDYYLDDRGDWVAVLDCHHGQHVRHDPPFQERPWVTTPEGRASKLGMLLDCVRCDRFEFPDGLSCYRTTPEFDETSIPAGLLREHTTKSGVWGKIRVSEGQLRYIVGDREQLLDPLTPGVVVPELEHRVVPVDHVRFKVEFYRSGSSP